MAFKLTIGDTLNVPLKGTINGAASAPVAFNFSLQMRRLPVAEYREVIAPESEVKLRDFLIENVQGWRGQKLVLDDEDQPAEFSVEAFDALLGIVGMEHTCFQAYIAALAIGETAKGRSGN